MAAETVLHYPGDPAGETPATGWIELGGLSVCLTRRECDGMLLVALEATEGEPVQAQVVTMQGPELEWEGTIA